MDNFHLQAIVLQNLEDAEAVMVHPRQHFIRNRNPFDLSNKLFIKHFRLTKNLVRYLINTLNNVLIPPTRTSSIDQATKVLVALNFFATGSYQISVGSNVHCSSVSQATVSRCINEVVQALNAPEIFNQWIRFPANVAELQRNRRLFYEKFNIPGIIGVIDCTHVAIFPPPANDPDYPEHIYVNRKNYHSLNVQIICDFHLKIININARFPGMTHDSHIWNNSAVCQQIIQLHRQQRGYYLIGDSGYALRPWLQIPLEHAEPGTQEYEYNETFKTARSSIERCNGLLKMRFRCLLKHRVLHYSPTKASQIINACAVLHNMCIENNVPVPEREDGDEELDFGLFEDDVNAIPAEPERANRNRNPDLVAGERLQRQIINNFRLH